MYEDNKNSNSGKPESNTALKLSSILLAGSIALGACSGEAGPIVTPGSMTTTSETPTSSVSETDISPEQIDALYVTINLDSEPIPEATHTAGLTFAQQAGEKVTEGTRGAFEYTFTDLGIVQRQLSPDESKLFDPLSAAEMPDTEKNLAVTQLLDASFIDALSEKGYNYDNLHDNQQIIANILLPGGQLPTFMDSGFYKAQALEYPIYQDPTDIDEFGYNQSPAIHIQGIAVYIPPSEDFNYLDTLLHELGHGNSEEFRGEVGEGNAITCNNYIDPGKNIIGLPIQLNTLNTQEDNACYILPYGDASTALGSTDLPLWHSPFNAIQLEQMNALKSEEIQWIDSVESVDGQPFKLFPIEKDFQSTKLIGMPYEGKLSELIAYDTQAPKVGLFFVSSRNPTADNTTPEYSLKVYVANRNENNEPIGDMYLISTGNVDPAAYFFTGIPGNYSGDIVTNTDYAVSVTAMNAKNGEATITFQTR